MHLLVLIFLFLIIVHLHRFHRPPLETFSVLRKNRALVSLPREA
jgi:hypothetical protein